MLLVALLLSLGGITAVATPSYAANTTYYVSTSGSDSNSGTSEGSPWQSLSKVNSTELSPGDMVLFRSGDTWTGKLTTNGSGSSSAPIVYGAYGGGSKPAINGAGVLPATVHVTGQQYLHITGLEITNTSSEQAYRSGILVDNPNTDPLKQIRLTDLSIHDVSGRPYVGQGDWSDPGDGGIIVTGRADSPTSRVDDLLIDNVAINNVDDAGVRIQPRNQSARATGTVVRNVRVNNAGGNGILAGNTSNALIEYNKVTGSGGRSTACAGIWPVYSDGSVLQYNEVSGQRTLVNDGFAFDLDWKNSNSVFQYNYSHDNPHGFIQFFQESTATVRYNISQNDAITFGFYNSGPESLEVYNNTIYRAPGSTSKILWNQQSGHAYNARFRNNIIVNHGSGTYDPSVGTWSNNLFFGDHPASEPSDPAKLTSDPLLVAPGTATSPTDASGYALQEGSPALSSGALIAANGGRDYFGNPVSASAAPHRGAYNGAPVGGSGPRNNGLYTLTAVHSGKVADVLGADTSNGATVVQWSGGGGDNQRWRAKDAGNGTFTLAAAHSGKCLDVLGASTANGAKVAQWSCLTGDNQKWRFEPAGSGTYRIVSASSGKCLDVTDASMENGAQLAQWTCWTGDNQKWRLTQVG
ncbi:RICIN domain-containing protein [Streptomyces coerulescens]|uniref:RICIN domain-containing protein n=1 Tax=Streptomyces coerulescens TaxID=29304 RepID=A0ABW0CXK4_STRCD